VKRSVNVKLKGGKASIRSGKHQKRVTPAEVCNGSEAGLLWELK